MKRWYRTIVMLFKIRLLIKVASNCVNATGTAIIDLRLLFGPFVFIESMVCNKPGQRMSWVLHYIMVIMMASFPFQCQNVQSHVLVSSLIVILATIMVFRLICTPLEVNGERMYCCQWQSVTWPKNTVVDGIDMKMFKLKNQKKFLKSLSHLKKISLKETGN